MADRLGELVCDGTKTATTSALWSYEPDKPLPQVGELSVVLGGNDEPLCIVELLEVRTLPFAEVDAAFAFDEGEGDRSLAYWRRAHERFFSRTLTEVGKVFDETMPVVCERFKKVFLFEGSSQAAAKVAPPHRSGCATPTRAARNETVPATSG